MNNATSGTGNTTSDPTTPPLRKERSRWFLSMIGFAVLCTVVAPTFLLWSGSRDNGDTSVFGTITGDLVVRLLDDGQRIRVEEELSYTDPQGRVWTVPAGFTSDGASIPRSLWSVVGGPLEGRYRVAALFHDVECEKGHLGICLVPSAEVHRMFYNAMRCSGVPDDQALLLWTAVHKFGPQWPACADVPTDPVRFNAVNRADALAVVDVDLGLQQRPLAENPILIGAKPSGADAPDPETFRRQIEAAPAPATNATLPVDWSSPLMQRLREAMRKHRAAVQHLLGTANGP